MNVKRFFPVLAFVLVVLSLPAVSFAQGEDEPPNLILLAQVAGPTIAGPTNVHLMVWDNGDVELAGQDAFHDSGVVCREQVGRGAVQGLRQSLMNNGAERLRNRIIPNTADLPSTTVTFFLAVEDSQQSLANTFTYNETVGSYSRIQVRLLAFVAASFKDCDLTF
jgi:hypothetical protein